MSPTEEVLSEGELASDTRMDRTAAHTPPPQNSSSKVLILFSGANQGQTSLRGCFQTLGLDAVTFDILDGREGDLTDDAIGRPLVSRIRNGEFSCMIAGPPCSTFSRARLAPGGPPPLR